MKIELKNLKMNLAFSQETIMFQADVYVDGVKTAYADNDGHGGCTNYHAYQGKQALLAKAEAHAASLPSKKYGTMTLKTTLESLIDELVGKEADKKERAKTDKRIQKLTLNHIVWGVPNGDSYQMLGFKGKPKFEDVKKVPQGRLALENLVKKVKKELKKGEVIFNTNL
jgi:hypothetical protein